MTPQAGILTPIERYYRLHSLIYDSTRWSFLFGRQAVLDRVASVSSPSRILEVGCGTGRNLDALCRRFPKAHVTGVDISDTMLSVARRKTAIHGSRVGLLHRSYDEPLHDSGPYNVVLFSYALSMFNPGWERAIECADSDLAPGGHIAVVDFHRSRHRAFSRWMGINHVRMDAHLRPHLLGRFGQVSSSVHRAYGGLWEYVHFLGRKKPESRSMEPPEAPCLRTPVR